MHLMKADLRSINAQIAALREKARRQKRSEDNGGLSPFAITVVMAVYVLGGHDLAAALACARQRGRLSSVVQEETMLTDMVVNWYLSASDEQEAAIHQPTNAAQGRTREAALSWLAEYRVYKWVSAQNDVRGVAPSSLDMLGRFTHECRQLGVQDRLPSLENMLDTAGRSARQWSRRFRRKWGIRLGRLKPREVCSSEEIAEKAGSMISQHALGMQLQ
jgi:hypothetical protein